MREYKADLYMITESNASGLPSYLVRAVGDPMISQPYLTTLVNEAVNLLVIGYYRNILLKSLTLCCL